MGIESESANCSEESRNCNFANEGGYEHRFRYLKNIMGLWMIQNVKRELNDKYSFSELCEMAEKEDIPSVVDCNSNKFLAPESMIDAVKNFCGETNQKVPETPGEIARVIYRSLASCYKEACEQIEKITGKTFGGINIVGGGSNADYLNRLTASSTGKTVYAGPSEATAIGNLACQIIASGDSDSIKEVRKLIADSTDIKICKP
jgi:rhamnulokinase